VFEKYWDYLTCHDQHQDFRSESEYTQYHMMSFSQALSGMSVAAFEPKPAAETKQSDVEISEEAVITRLRPIEDGLNYWKENRSSASTVSRGSAPG
jgi:hypothetical protein